MMCRDDVGCANQLKIDYIIAFYSYLSKHGEMQKSSLFHGTVLILVFYLSIFYQYSTIKRLIYILNAPHLKHTSSKIIFILHL